MKRYHYKRIVESIADNMNKFSNKWSSDEDAQFLGGVIEHELGYADFVELQPAGKGFRVIPTNKGVNAWCSVDEEGFKHLDEFVVQAIIDQCSERGINVRYISGNRDDGSIGRFYIDDGHFGVEGYKSTMNESLADSSDLVSAIAEDMPMFNEHLARLKEMGSDGLLNGSSDTSNARFSIDKLLKINHKISLCLRALKRNCTCDLN